MKILEPTTRADEYLDKESEELSRILSHEGKREEDRKPLEKFGEGWKYVPRLKDLKQEFQNAKQFHDAHMLKVQEWRHNLAAPDLNLGNTKKNKSKLQPKLIRKHAEWRYASLSEPFLSNDSLFNVAPRTWEDRDNANKSAILLNYQFTNQIDLVNFIDTTVRSVVNDGTVLLKPSWLSEYSTVEEEVHTYQIAPYPSENFQEVFDTALWYYDNSPSQYLTEVPPNLKKSVEYFLAEGTTVEFIITETRKVKKKKLTVNRPRVDVVPIDQVYLDPSCGNDVNNSKMVIYELETSIADLTADGRYKNLDWVDVKGNSWTVRENLVTGNSDNTFNFEDRIRARIKAYEYWGFQDIHGTGELVPIVATWVGDTLIRMEESPLPGKRLPIIAIPYMPQTHSPYGVPDGELLADNQKIIGAIQRGIIDILSKNANGQQGIPKNLLDDVNKRLFQAGEDFEYNPTLNPSTSVLISKFSEIPQSAFTMLGMINAEAESLTGIKAYNDGLTEASLGKVATAVRGLLDASSKRESNILRRLAKGIEEVGKRFLAMSAEFLEDEELVRITNDRFVKIQRKELAGEYDLKISVVSAEENSARSQELSFMLQTLGPSVPLPIANKLLVEYARINKLPDIAHEIKNYQPEPDPLQEQMQLLALQEMSLKIEQAKLNLDATQIENALKVAEIAHTQAKTAKARSEADLSSLDFVEQESGVKQARDVERIQAQAMGNIQLEERKAQLNEIAQRRQAIQEYVTRRANPGQN